MATHPQFQLFNPMRPPQWRSDRALSLRENNPPLRPSAYDDKHVREYSKFLRKYMETRANPDARMSLYPRWPGIFMAQFLHFDADTEWRAIVQARLLAGCSFEEIASNLGTLPCVIEWYERLFFNVLDRLECHDYIVKSVLGTALERAANREGTITDYQRDLSYKLFGYFGGPLVLDIIISGFTSGTLPTSAGDVAPWLNKTIKGLLRSKAAVAAKTFEVNKFNVMQLFELQLATVTQDAQLKELKGTSDTKLEPIVNALLDQVPWKMAIDQEKFANQAQIAYLDSAVEPRLHEHMVLNTGQIPKSLREEEITIFAQGH